MAKKIYIASGLKNYKRVLELRDKFAEHGITLTYDWAESYRHHIENIVETGVAQEENLQEIAENEYKGVVDCDLFFMMCPAGRGGHFELGVAYAHKKPIVICYEDHYEPIAFYMLPEICGFHSEDNAVDYVLEVLAYEES